ncbi:MAG: GNAT family N-acetyltransferase [Verrucomicrobia bacterium]|nr:GNAT family N-acetyltransferase [Verrucomicrobiota bacterium]
MKKQTILPSAESDLTIFKDFWERAIAYQKLNSLPCWYDFPEKTIVEEIRDGRHFTIHEDGAMLGYVSISFTDPEIWEELEDDRAIFLHRMCVNPAMKGNQLAAITLKWALKYSTGMKRDFVRIDTWASNNRLIEYYLRCGFVAFGKKRPSNPEKLPPHYSNIELMLFQNSCA